LRTVLDTFTTNRRVDPGRIGVFGASLGAITGSLVAAADPRIKASVLIVGSGNLSGMSTHTTLPKAVQLRRQRKRILKLRTDDQY
ncbi:acyl-CoA thioester hydrolase/BAAT C-terminal domain-containing protein, partial [Acinetobacter baumannii]